MQCSEFRDHLFDVVLGESVTSEVKSHLSTCLACAEEINSMHKTMALLDEWKAPADTSPYFMTRLKARVREESSREVSPGWLSWFRKPALAVSMAALLVASVAFFQGAKTVPDQPPSKGAVSAVNDIQYLDKNSDVLQNLELLDDLGDNSTTVNQ
jgi:anti-sigma factor RsiW